MIVNMSKHSLALLELFFTSGNRRQCLTFSTVLFLLLSLFIESSSCYLLDKSIDDDTSDILSSSSSTAAPESFADENSDSFSSLSSPFSSYSSASSASASSSSSSVNDQWSNRKTIFKIKIIKPSLKELNIHEERRLRDYIENPNLDFDSPYKQREINNCKLNFKPINHEQLRNNFDLLNKSESISVQITGNESCVDLPLQHLTPIGNNIVHLVIHNTGIKYLTKYMFAGAKLYRLQRLDIINNKRLTKVESRVFDGLNYLSYLSLVNNLNLNSINLEMFAGIKAIEELIFVGNGGNADFFQIFLKSIASNIMPNLIHLHFSSRFLRSDHFDVIDISPQVNNYVQSDLNKSESEVHFVEISADENDTTLAERNDNEHNHTSDDSDLIALPSDAQLLVESIGRTNRFIKVTKTDLKGLNNLRYLQLTDCNIVNIDKQAFAPLLRNLLSLNLAGNPRLTIANLKEFLSVFYVKNINLLNEKINNETRNLLRQQQGSNRNYENPDDHPVSDGNVSNNSDNSNKDNANGVNRDQNDINDDQTKSVATGLKYLDLSSSLTTKRIPKDLFLVISKTTITHLYLKNLLWENINYGDLPPMPLVELLYLDNNKISFIHDNAFEGLESLTHLSLSGNRLKEISPYLFEPIRNLKYLDLSGEPRKFNYSHSEHDNRDNNREDNFSNYQQDETDDYDGDEFILPQRTFIYSTNLQELNLNNKKLTKLTRNMFLGLFKLEKLNISNCRLKMIDYLTFFPLKSIKFLDLSLNPYLVKNLRKTDEDTFVGLEFIEEINLSKNDIVSDDLNDYNLFKRLQEHLKVINLSNNLITKLYSQTFRNFTELKFLNLSNNQIKSWSNYTLFNKNLNLVSLDLSFNLIETITTVMLGDFARLKNLSFANNPLQCSCRWNGPILLLNEKINNKNSQNQFYHSRQNNLLLSLTSNSYHSSFLFNNDNEDSDSAADGNSNSDGNSNGNGDRGSNVDENDDGKSIDEHLEKLAHRQQMIVSTAFRSLNKEAALPKSIIDWLNSTDITFFHDHHPLRSESEYWCHNEPENSYNRNSESKSVGVKSAMKFKDFFKTECSLDRKYQKLFINFTLLSVFGSGLLLLTLVLLLVVFIYHSTIRNIFSMVDDDFLHNYKYDAFVSYNVNDSDWVFKQLIPRLENYENEETNAHANDVVNKEIEKNVDAKVKANQIKLCVYDRDFIAGRAISECITESIKESRKVILVISENFARSPWCRFETDLAHHTLMDQNREGLVLVKLEDISNDLLESVAPQLHFLLKTRIYLQWSHSERDQEIFWRKLRNSLGFISKHSPYGSIKEYYQNYFKQNKLKFGDSNLIKSNIFVNQRRHSLVLMQSQDSCVLNHVKYIEDKSAF